MSTGKSNQLYVFISIVYIYIFLHLYLFYMVSLEWNGLLDHIITSLPGWTDVTAEQRKKLLFIVETRTVAETGANLTKSRWLTRMKEEPTKATTHSQIPLLIFHEQTPGDCWTPDSWDSPFQRMPVRLNRRDKKGYREREREREERERIQSENRKKKWVLSVLVMAVAAVAWWPWLGLCLLLSSSCLHLDIQAQGSSASVERRDD